MESMKASCFPHYQVYQSLDLLNSAMSGNGSGTADIFTTSTNAGALCNVVNSLESLSCYWRCLRVSLQDSGQHHIFLRYRVFKDVFFSCHSYFHGMLGLVLSCDIIVCIITRRR